MSERNRLLSPGRWVPAIRDGLEEMVVRYGRTSPGYDPAKPPVATFDWDNTSIQGDIGEAALVVLDARDGGSRMAEYERMCVEAGKTVAYPWCAYQIAGMTEPEVRRFTLGIVEAWTRDGRMRPRPEMRELVAAMQAEGWQVYAVTASAELLVRAFAQYYGIPQTHVLGMRLAVDRDGALLPELVGPNTYRGGKVEIIDLAIGRRPTFAAGDSDTDIEMLAASTHRLVVDHGNPALAEAARDGGWWVQPVFA